MDDDDLTDEINKTKNEYSDMDLKNTTEISNKILKKVTSRIDCWNKSPTTATSSKLTDLGTPPPKVPREVYY